MDRRELADDPGASFRAAFAGMQSGLWTAMPAAVTSFDAAKMTAEVQPSVQGRIQDQFGNFRWANMPLLVDCPVVFPSGGGFSLTFPVAAGDECLVVFASRCVDSWWQSGGIQVQAEMRMHDLSDGFVLVGPRSQPRVLAAVSATEVQLRSDDGGTYVSIDGGGNVGVVAAGDLVATAAGQATLTAAAITLNGPVVVNGTITATGLVSAPDFATPTLPSYVLHQHDNVRGGPDLCNPPLIGT